MPYSDGEYWECQAGREADFGGRWLLPCTETHSEHRHHLVTIIGTFDFCDKHMIELIEAGLITDPYISHEGAGKLVDDERRDLGL